MNTKMPSQGRIWTGLVVVGVGGCAGAPPVPSPPIDVTQVAAEVTRVERAFAATMAQRDLAKFKTFLAEETVFVSGPRPLRGKQQVSEEWKRFFDSSTAPFSWDPERVEVLDSGSLALSTGPVRTPNGQIVATFTSIWRKEPTGWHIVFDRGVDIPECASSIPSEKAAIPDFVLYRQKLVEAQGAYERRDYAVFLTSTLQADAAVPNTPRAIYNGACGYALTGKSDEALASLQKLVRMNVYFDISRDDDLASLRELPAFGKLREAFAALDKRAVNKSAPAFTLSERQTIPEGITHDPKTGAFFVSSIHERKIIRILPPNKPADFITTGLDAVMGMAVDEKRRTLWACSSAVPEMKGFVDADKGRAKLVAIDVDKGSIRQTFTFPEPGSNHVCNDLAVDAEGRIFVSDPGASTLYSLPLGAAALEVFVPPGKLASPQGVVVTPDGQSLFVADYSRGLFRINRATREVDWLVPPADTTLVGIDGLVLMRGDLLAIQNGLRPHRVLRIALDAGGKTIRNVQVLEMNHPAFNEPTLGVSVGQDLFYVANSQWGSFDKGVIWPAEKLKEPVILKLRVD